MARPLDPQARGQRVGRSVSAVAEEDVAFQLFHFGLLVNAAKKICVRTTGSVFTGSVGKHAIDLSCADWAREPFMRSGLPSN